MNPPKLDWNRMLPYERLEEFDDEDNTDEDYSEEDC